MAMTVRPEAEVRFICRLPNGLHARPASHLSAVALPFDAEATLVNARTGASANVKSVLALIAADVRCGDACVITTRGATEADLASALRTFIDTELDAHDTSHGTSYDTPHAATQPADGAEPHAVPVPVWLRSHDVSLLPGVSVCRGIAVGPVVIAGRAAPIVDETPRGSPDDEQARMDRAVEAVRSRLGRSLAERDRGIEADIVAAHLAMVQDIAFVERIRDAVRRGQSAGRAVADAGAFFASTLEVSDNAYLRDRAFDVHDVTQYLLAELSGRSDSSDRVGSRDITLSAPSILVGDHLTPRQLLGLDRARLLGLILEHAGATSHTVILARAFGIPTLVGARGAARMMPAGSTAVVDAVRGFAVADASDAVRTLYAREMTVEARRREIVSRDARQSETTADGHRLEIGANVSSAQEIGLAFAQGADGIGLLRTEMLFMHRDAPPTEDEQFEIYARAARAAEGRPVIIRALDIGGDKPLLYLSQPAESNPFLGVRGVRIYSAYPELVRVHLRAIARASAVGRVQLMIPMVSSVDEVVWFKAQLADVQRALRDEGVAFNASMPVGAMIEVPVAAMIVDALSAELDFFSIGTNDLSQYFLAADRGNPAVAALSNVRHPGFVRLLRQIVRDVHAHGKWVGVCGEMASDPSNLPLFVALGVDEISVTPSAVPELKARMSRLTFDACRTLLNRVTACARSAEVEAILACATGVTFGRPLLTSDLVVWQDDSATKADAIHAVVGALYAAGRTDAPDAVESAVLAREATYSTGLGYGIAIPHCKTDAVVSDSIAVLRLLRPVEWGAVDGAPVHLVIVLATRASSPNTHHLQIFSGLARKLMHPDFRARLLACADADALVAYLSAELAVDRSAGSSSVSEVVS